MIWPKPEFRQWLSGVPGRPRVNGPIRFRGGTLSNHVRVVPVGRIWPGQAAVAEDRSKRSAVQQDAKNYVYGVAQYFARRCRHAAVRSLWWSSPTMAAQQKSKANSLHPDSNGGTDRYAQPRFSILYDPDRATRFKNRANVTTPEAVYDSLRSFQTMVAKDEFPAERNILAFADNGLPEHS